MCSFSPPSINHIVIPAAYSFYSHPLNRSNHYIRPSFCLLPPPSFQPTYPPLLLTPHSPLRSSDPLFRPSLNRLPLPIPLPHLFLLSLSRLPPQSPISYIPPFSQPHPTRHPIPPFSQLATSIPIPSRPILRRRAEPIRLPSPLVSAIQPISGTCGICPLVTPPSIIRPVCGDAKGGGDTRGSGLARWGGAGQGGEMGWGGMGQSGV